MTNKPSISLSFLILSLFTLSMGMNIMKALIPSSVMNLVFYGLLICGLSLKPILSPGYLRFNALQMLSVANIITLIISFAYSMIVINADTIAALSFFFQFSLIWATVFLVTENAKRFLSQTKLIKLLDRIFVLLSFIISLSFLERLIPDSVLARIVAYITLSKGFALHSNELPLSYFMIELGFPVRRAASIFFEPVTFALVSSVAFAALLEYRWLRRELTGKPSTLNLSQNHFIFAIAAFLSFVKTGFLLVLAAASSRINKAVVVMIAGLASMFLMLNLHRFQLASILVHVDGLANGLLRASEAPLAGHGMGTAGFLAYSSLLQRGIADRYFDVGNLSLNGNESLIGIIAYQFGYLYLAWYVLSFCLLSIQLRKRLRILPYYALGVLVVALFTESTLSILFQFSTATLISLLYCLAAHINANKRIHSHV